MKLVKTVYNVSKRLSTKTIDAGDYDTADQAIAAMLEHYKTNAKRGDFYYKITRENIEEDASGFQCRTISYNVCTLQDPDMHRTYNRRRLDTMLQEQLVQN